jgi:hypothetical protein
MERLTGMSYGVRAPNCPTAVVKEMVNFSQNPSEFSASEVRMTSLADSQHN